MYQCDTEMDLDTGDFAAVISIEPVPDNGAGPFMFKPLAGMIPVDGLNGSNMIGNQVADTFPTGTAMITGTVAATPSNWGSLKASFR